MTTITKKIAGVIGEISGFCFFVYCAKRGEYHVLFNTSEHIFNDACPVCRGHKNDEENTCNFFIMPSFETSLVFFCKNSKIHLNKVNGVPINIFYKKGPCHINCQKVIKDCKHRTLAPTGKGLDIMTFINKTGLIKTITEN